MNPWAIFVALAAGFLYLFFAAGSRGEALVWAVIGIVCAGTAAGIWLGMVH